VARAQYVPRFFVLKVEGNAPFEAVIPDALATIGPEQLPDATRIVVEAPASGAAVAASLAVAVSGTLKRFPDLVMFPFATATFICLGETTSTEANPENPPSEAVTDPLPAVDPAVNVELPPVVGETVPGAVVDHVAPETETAFPYWSAPLAENAWVPPNATVAVGGDTVSVASGPPTMVSVWEADAYPFAIAVSVGVPAVRSWYANDCVRAPPAGTVVVRELLHDPEPDAEKSPVDELDVTVTVSGALGAGMSRRDIDADAVPAVIVCGDVANDRAGVVGQR
jgi:hypothetical protein